MASFSLMTSRMSSTPMLDPAGGMAAPSVESASSGESGGDGGGVGQWRSQTERAPFSHLTSSTSHVAKSETFKTTFSEIETTSS